MELKDEDFRRAIERGDAAGVRDALQWRPDFATRTIRWYLNQFNDSDPLHFVADCVGNGWLTNESDGEIATLLLEHGAAIEGSEGRESPLVASASLGAVRACKVLIEAGANLEATSIYEARALHWAAWTGAAATVELLIAHGAMIERRDAEFGATPLFWAVHGLGPAGAKLKNRQLDAARLLLNAGADAHAVNKHGQSVRDLAESFPDQRMFALLNEYP